MSDIIEIRDLTKRYGSTIALKRLTLNVPAGSVVGFIGPNGAGKTTTMRILTTLLQPTGGDARIAGYSIARQPEEVRRAIGYMPDYFGVYDDMKVWEYLDFFAACYDIPPSERRPMISDLLALVDLTHKREAYVETLSRGMKQRLCLARTLAHDPQVLILDEPASGLDPRARIEIRELLNTLREMGKTIFFSSHILSEVADICDRIAVLEAGELVAYDDIDQMRRRLRAHRLIEIRVLGETQPLIDHLAAYEHVTQVFAVSPNDVPFADGSLRIEFNGDDEAISVLLGDLIAAGFRVVTFREEVGDLEDVFLQLTQGIVA